MNRTCQFVAQYATGVSQMAVDAQLSPPKAKQLTEFCMRVAVLDWKPRDAFHTVFGEFDDKRIESNQ